MEPYEQSGLIKVPGRTSVAETVVRLERLLAARGLKLFAIIDHSGEAEQAGLAMQNTKLMIFGNPSAGTPLMKTAPSIAIDLPLKILIAEDEEGKTWVSYNDPRYLLERHHLNHEFITAIQGVAAIAEEIAR